MTQVSRIVRRAHVNANVRPGIVNAAFVVSLVFIVSACATHVGPVDENDAPSDLEVAAHESIVHGAADHGRHPAVVALVSQGGHALCSGSLIASDFVLTARHCVSSMTSEAVKCPTTRAQVGANIEPSSIVVVNGDEVASGRVLAVGREIFTPPVRILCDHDIALIRLDRSIDSTAPLRFSHGAVKLSRGYGIVAVGYGLAGTSGAGKRRFRSDVPIISSTTSEFTVAEATCGGDSGGPAIDPESGTIVGVVSRGSDPCEDVASHNIYTRVDAFSTWVDAIIGHRASSGPPSPSPVSDSGGVGDACENGSTCASGLCVTSMPHGYCSQKCGRGVARCPDGYRCARIAASSSSGCARE